MLMWLNDTYNLATIEKETEQQVNILEVDF